VFQNRFGSVQLLLRTVVAAGECTTRPARARAHPAARPARRREDVRPLLSMAAVATLLMLH